MSESHDNRAAGSEDYALVKIPSHVRMTGFDISLVYTGFIVITSAVVLGVTLAESFHFWTAFWILAGGSAIVVVNAILIGYIGYRERTSLALTMRFGFGNQGSRLPSALLVVTNQGWWIIQLLMLQWFWTGLGFWTTSVLLILSGILMTVTSRSGIQKGMKWLNRIVIPGLLLVFTIAIYRVVGVAGGWQDIVSAEPPKLGEIGISAGIIMTASLWINGSTVFPDVARYARSATTVIGAPVIAFLVGLFGLGLTGVVFYDGLGTGEFGPVFGAVGLTYLAFIAVFGQIWTTNQAQMYSSSLAMSNAFRISRSFSEVTLLAVSLVLTVALSTLPFQSVFIGFLTILGLFLTPVPGIVFAEYYVIRRMVVPAQLADLPSVNRLALGTYALTVVLNVFLWATVSQSASVGLITLNPLTAFVLHLIFKVVFGKLALFRDRAPMVD